MALVVAGLSFELVGVLAPLVPRIRQRDRSLADQLTRAANSVVLNIAEAQHSDPGNRRARLFTAAGSASETLAAVKLAVAWRHLPACDADDAAKILNRILAILWRMTRG